VDLNPIPFEVQQGNVKVEEKIEVSFNAASGIVTIPELPEHVAAVLAAVSTGNQVTSCGSGTGSIQLSQQDLQGADWIRVFYLDDQYRPVAKPGLIRIK